ncbi:MAG TPA: carboxyl transferase domain-containing protein, partial [Actinophytocola sp.]|nr:carboxyl transferase domain-containing protein [Actinophytocola sp.]
PEHADDPAYTAAAQHAAGHVDEVLTDLPARLAEWLTHLRGTPADPVEIPRALGALTPATDGWHAVRRARAPERPRAAAYLDDYFDTRLSIRGDRAGGVDDGVLCGIGRRRGRSIAFAAQTGTATTPAGFRTASRLVRLADRLGIPVLTLVDTPGAAAGPDAERAGVGPAIAELFATIAGARVPVTTLVVGEGGSGGALALCSVDRVWITPDAYFSVIAPELAAAILKRDPADVPELASQLKLRPQDLLELGVVHGIASP